MNGISVRFLGIILLTQALSLTFTYVVWLPYTTSLYVVPEETSVQYGFFLSLIPILSSFILLKFLKREYFRIYISLIQAAVVGLASYVIIEATFPPLSLPISAILTIASMVGLIYGGRRTKKVFIILFSSLTSALLALTLPPLAVLTFSAIMAAFDVYAVFIGPLSKAPLPLALSLEVGNAAIGIGDIIFYALITSSLFIHKGVYHGLLALLAIESGALASYRLLKRRPLLPGLPIPLLLSLPLFLF
jgi:hypothetical protein